MLAAAYQRNSQHLAPWDPLREDDFFTSDWQEAHVATSLVEADAGRSARFVLVDDAEHTIVGRVNVNNIVRGAFWSADLGYWIDGALSGRGLMTRAVAAARAHAASVLQLHRLQAATLLHNTASQRVLAANGFERIGVAPKYLHIAGEWQDHILLQRILTP